MYGEPWANCEDVQPATLDAMLEQPAMCFEVAGCVGSLRALACLTKPLWKVAVQLQPSFRTPILYVLAGGLESGGAGVSLQVGTGRCRMLPALSKTIDKSSDESSTEFSGNVRAVELDGRLCAFTEFIDGRSKGYSMKIYEPRQRSWRECFPRQRGELELVVPLDRWLYIFGRVQHDSGEWTLQLERYSPFIDERQPLPPAPTSRCRSGVVSLDGCIYVIGGYAFGGTADEGPLHPLGVVECFNPATNIWREVAPLSAPRFMCKAVAAGGCIYTIGGLDLQGHPPIPVERYDPALDTWTLVAPMPMQRCAVEVIEYRGSILAFGGLSAKGEATADVELYCTDTGTWRSLPSADFNTKGRAHCSLAMAACAGGIYTVFTQDNWLKADLVIQRYIEDSRKASAGTTFCRLPVSRGHLCAVMVLAPE